MPGSQCGHDERPRSLLQDHSGEQRVTNIELFFDLVYVFAVTQMSHHLLALPTVDGALQTALLLALVWWAWVYTTWATNWQALRCTLFPAASFAGPAMDMQSRHALPAGAPPAADPGLRSRAALGQPRAGSRCGRIRLTAGRMS